MLISVSQACEWPVCVRTCASIGNTHTVPLLARPTNGNSREQTGKEKSRLPQESQPILDLCYNNVNRQ